MNTNSPTVLIVEDERGLAELYGEWLSDEYETRLAFDGDEALTKISDGVDVVLLDRRMPGLSGGEVLETIRDRGYDVQVAMVTAVEPDYDIIEMGFDDYIVKPIKGHELASLVDDLLSRSSYDDTMRQYYELASKKAALETAKSQSELEESDEYAALISKYEEVKSRADDSVSSLMKDSDASTLF